MKHFIFVTLLAISVSAKEVKIHDLLCDAMNDTSLQVQTYAGATENFKKIMFLEALDTAVSNNPHILSVYKDTLDSVTYKIKNIYRDFNAMRVFIASDSMKTMGLKCNKFRESYLNNILWNIRFPSFIEKDLMDILMDGLCITNLPEYKEAVEDSKKPIPPNKLIDMGQVMKEIKLQLHIPDSLAE
jgi:hypothetical protein